MLGCIVLTYGQFVTANIVRAKPERPCFLCLKKKIPRSKFIRIRDLCQAELEIDVSRCLHYKMCLSGTILPKYKLKIIGEEDKKITLALFQLAEELLRILVLKISISSAHLFIQTLEKAILLRKKGFLTIKANDLDKALLFNTG